MMKKLAILGLSTLLLTGCATSVMDPVKYNKSVTMQSNDSAYLYWDQGKVIAKELQTDNTSEITIMLSPNAYKMQYGPARQAIFMTSLRDQLVKHGLFQNVTLETAPKKLTKGHVIVDVWFKKTEVKSADEHGSFPSVLYVTLLIKGYNQPLFTKDLTIKSKSGLWTAMTYNFKDQTEYLSQQLMNQIFKAIVEWNDKNGSK